MSVYLHRSGLLGGGAVAGAGGGDPFFANVSLLLHFDGTDGSTTFTDSSSNGFSPSVIGGDVQIDTAQSKFGGASGLFDGVGDYLRYADNTAFEIGSQAFTIEGWARITAFDCNFCGKWAGPNGNREYALLIRSSDILFAYSTTGSNQINITKTWSPSTATWYHIAVCKDGSGNLRIFVDGSQIGTTETSVPAFSTGAAPFHIGVLGDGAAGTSISAGSQYDGWIDDLRLTVGAARYTSNFTPPTAAFPDS